MAKQLLVINRQFKLKENFSKEIFKISSAKYIRRFWKEGILPFISNYDVRAEWNESTDEAKINILNRLGINIPIVKESKIKCLFDGIAQEVIKEIRIAKNSIKIAMAWFTNFDIFNILKEKLEENIDIAMITNNDLINNGGYCLNLNELIVCGMKIYLMEYPDLLHHKFCIIDDKTLMSGSYNWTFFSEEINRENLIIIKDDNEVVQSYKEEFQSLIKGKAPIVQMPSSVPERPEYDRSSFKQYISEELVIRTKRKIGNTLTNLKKAKSLSPQTPTVIKALKEYNIQGDNSSLTLEQMEREANENACLCKCLHNASVCKVPYYVKFSNKY